MREHELLVPGTPVSVEVRGVLRARPPGIHDKSVVGMVEVGAGGPLRPIYGFETVLALRSPAELHLTSRELATLHLIAQGFSTEGICRELYIARPTVNDRVRQIREKLGALNRPHMVSLAVEHGLLDLRSLRASDVLGPQSAAVAGLQVLAQ